MPIVGVIGSLLSTIFSGLFTFKGQQAEVVKESLKLLGDVNTTDAQAQVAAAQAISSILTQGSFLERNWRPTLMVVLMVIIISFWFGHIPPHFNDALSPMMDKIFNLLTIGVGGYIPCRTFEKIIQQVNIGSILKALINKKIV